LFSFSSLWFSCFKVPKYKKILGQPYPISNFLTFLRHKKATAGDKAPYSLFGKTLQPKARHEKLIGVGQALLGG